MMTPRRARRFARGQKSEIVRRWYFWRLYLDEYNAQRSDNAGG